jgi:hypothetical protein
MDKGKFLKYGGLVAVAAGSIMLYFSGDSAASVQNIVAGVFVVIGIIAGLLKAE